MKWIFSFVFVLGLILGIAILYRPAPEPVETVIPVVQKPEPIKQDVTDTELSAITAKSDLILVSKPVAGTKVGNPLEVSGIARGFWYFEGSFPLIVTNWDGLIIGEGYATAAGDWMTEGFVPFSGSVAYTLPADETNFRGHLILKKDNPSGLPDKDDAIEIPVIFD